MRKLVKQNDFQFPILLYIAPKFYFIIFELVLTQLVMFVWLVKLLFFHYLYYFIMIFSILYKLYYDMYEVII
jgi:hypothetical protein